MGSYQVKGIAAEEDRLLPRLIAEGVRRAAVLAAIEVGLGEEVVVVAGDVVLIVVEDGGADVGNAGERGGGDEVRRAEATEAGGGAGAAPVVSGGVGRGELAGILLDSDELLRCPASQSKEEEIFLVREEMGVEM